MPQEPYDVVVLGGGAGGVPAAIRAAQLGARTALIERRDVGGLCMNRGCVPYGHMMVAARILGGLDLGKAMGIECSGVSTDFSVLMTRQEELIAFMQEGVKSTLKKNGVEIVHGNGCVAGPGKLEVDGKPLGYRKLILASGGQWLPPDFPGADLEGVINSDDLLSADTLPEKTLLFGASPWLIEMAQFLNGYGAQVTLATPEKSLLADESKAIRTRLAKALKHQNIPALTRAAIRSVEKKTSRLRCVLAGKDGEETLDVDRVISFRRSASLSGLGLETLGLSEDAEYLEVDEQMQTPADGVYAIGDITAPESRHYSHLSSSAAIVAAENATGGESVFNDRNACRVLFTQPQVACVGLTGREAKKAGHDVLEGAAPLSMNPAGMLTSQSEGLVEVVADKRYGEILGVHVIGETAAEIAGHAVLAIQLEATLEDLAGLALPHPTLSESLAEAARDALGRSIYLP